MFDLQPSRPISNGAHARAAFSLGLWKSTYLIIRETEKSSIKYGIQMGAGKAGKA
jgi:hypothetical protein